MAFSAASQVAGHAMSQSDTTSGDMGHVAASRSCSAASKTGGVLPPATIAVRLPSSPPSPSLPSSSSGCDQRVLTLGQAEGLVRYCNLDARSRLIDRVDRCAKRPFDIEDLSARHLPHELLLE